MTLEEQFEYTRQVGEIHGKIDFCNELVEELVLYWKWPFISKDRLIKKYLTRAHKLDDILKEL